MPLATNCSVMNISEFMDSPRFKRQIEYMNSPNDITLLHLQ